MRCGRCGSIFNSEDADTRPELVGEFWGSPAYIEIDICPECGSDDLEEIEQPYEECDENEDCDGNCEDCKIARLKEEEDKDHDDN
jgi:hypothetical protein